MTNVLVTGAGGFIGSHLVEKLVKEGCNVTAFLHYNSRNDIGNLKFLSQDVLSEIKTIKGDIQDQNSVFKATNKQDVVFHLAALIGIPYSYEAPESYINTNIKGTYNVLEGCLKHGCKLIHTSTSEVYGDVYYLPMDERHPLTARSPYAATKIAADHLVSSYVNSFDSFRAVTIRPFNTYGPRQSLRAVIPNIISSAINGNTIKIGNIKAKRDFNFVEDTVNAFYSTINKKLFYMGVYNIGSGKSHSIAQIIDIVSELLGRKINITTDRQRLRPDTSEVEELLCDANRAKVMLKWEPKTNIEDGLKKTIEHMQFYKSLIPITDEYVK